MKVRIRNVNLLLMLLLSAIVISCFSKKDSQPERKGSKEKEKKTEKVLNEDEMQKGKGINGELPAPVYTYEGILNQARGVILDGRIETRYYSENSTENKEMWRKAVIPELEKMGKIPDNIDEAGIERVFRQFLYITALKYLPVEDIDKYSYVIFKKDMADPFTGRKIQEDMQINIEIVLDASGSMKKKIGNETMMDIAKNSINKLMEELPENSNVALRVFGHKGNNNADGKEVSCAANELVQPLEKLNKEKIGSALQNIQPTGWTSIAKSIENGSNDLKGFQGEKHLNILYIVTDGIETCGGNPEEIAKKFKSENNNVVLGIIGFNVDAAQNGVLKKIAEAAGGRYSSVYDSKNLIYELLKIHEMAYSKYEWVTLDRELFERIKQNHEISLDWQNLAKGQALSENLALDDLLHVATIDAETGMPNPIIEFSGNVDRRLYKMAGERKEKIEAIYDEEIQKRKIKSDEYIAMLESRIGEEVAYIEVRSIFNPYSKYFKDTRERSK